VATRWARPVSREDLRVDDEALAVVQKRFHVAAPSIYVVRLRAVVLTQPSLSRPEDSGPFWRKPMDAFPSRGRARLEVALSLVGYS